MVQRKTKATHRKMNKPMQQQWSVVARVAGIMSNLYIWNSSQDTTPALYRGLLSAVSDKIPRFWIPIRNHFKGSR